MPYIYEGQSYGPKDLRDALAEDYNIVSLAVEFFDLNHNPIMVGPLRLDCSQVLWAMIGQGSLNPDTVVSEFMGEYTKAVRNGTTDRIELPYDLEDLDIRYVRDSAASKSVRGTPRKAKPKAGSKSTKSKARTAPRRR